LRRSPGGGAPRRLRIARIAGHPAEREQRVRDLTAAAEENAKALNAAALFEIDDVIDPAETRGLIASTLAAARAHKPEPEPGGRFIDAW